MAYGCCDLTFDTEKEFKKHIRSRNWHRLNYADVVKIRMKDELLYRIIKNPNLLFGITNLFTPVQDKAILYLPFIKEGYGLVLKRSIVGKLEGPKIELGGVRYRFYSPDLIYDLDFRIKKINEENYDLSILASMMVNIGFLGRLFPGQVMKSLQKMITPQILVDKIAKGLSTIS